MTVSRAAGIRRKGPTSCVRARGVGVALQRSAATQAPWEAHHHVREGGLRRILCIDDDVDMLHVVHDMFLGRRVRQADLTLLSRPFMVEEMMEVVGRIAERAS